MDRSKFFGIRGWIPTIRNVGPSLRKFLVEFCPHACSRVAIRDDRFDRAFGLANAAIDAIALPDYKHISAFIKAIYRTDQYAVRIFAPYAAVSHNERHVIAL